MTKQIECEQALRQIYEFIDHELGDVDRKEMERHLHTCKSCFSRMEFERRLKEKLGKLREGGSSVEARERIEELLKEL